MYPDNPEGTQVIVGLMNMGYIYPHCQEESNSQPVPSQAGADPTRMNSHDFFKLFDFIVLNESLFIFFQL